MIKFYYLFFFLFAFGSTYAQVGIGTTTPNASAALEISSTDQGLLIPRVALTATNISGPLTAHVNGMIVYNTNSSGSANTAVTPGFYFNDGAKWVRLADNLAINGLDKTDDEWVNKTGSIEVGKQSNGAARTLGSEFVVKDNGNVGIGLTNPGVKLEINSATANTSGLKLTKLTSSTATSTGATLGVDATGNVITVDGALSDVIFTASLGTGNGGNTNATIAATAFNTVPLPTVTKNLGGGTWNASNNTYSVPKSGTYIIKSTIRLIDGSTSSSRNIYQAVHTSNIDIPDGIWQVNPAPVGTGRWTMLYTRIAYFNQGDLLRLYIYSDGQVANLSDASLNIFLLSNK
mgnify:CR=1 FL=1